jgi:hypothetical protein
MFVALKRSGNPFQKLQRSDMYVLAMRVLPPKHAAPIVVPYGDIYGAFW